ncbi:hypothetical protein ABGB18_24585 [Nonomuraea sp. B12E4]|uniref:hypothetical protein n=1 Tax=Nonomuraea sp. B12E4 TaxID=3153564 RepID=UPI00325C5D45
MSEVREAAREHGLGPALTLLTTGVAGEALPCGPGGHAIVPAPVARGARLVWLGGVPADRDRAGEVVIGELEVEGEHLTILRHPPVRDAPARITAPVALPVITPVTAWAHGLAWLRLGLSERLLGACTGYLRRRKAGDTTLLLQQLVKGELAEVVIEHLEIEAALADRDAGAPALSRLHTQITRADRALLRLLGASGFTREGSGWPAHVSELLADVYAGSAHP